MMGINPLSGFHKPSSYVKKRYWLIGFPLVGTVVVIAYIVIVAADILSKPLKLFKRGKRK